MVKADSIMSIGRYLQEGVSASKYLPKAIPKKTIYKEELCPENKKRVSRIATS